MKKIGIITILAVLLLAACGRKADTAGRAEKFHNEVVIKTTPVKDQGRSPLCWLYAMLATIESDRLMLGDSVCLSPDYLARLWLQTQARTYYLTRGQRSLSLRGMAPMTLRLLNDYGAEPYDSYHPYEAVNYNVLCRTMKSVARASASIGQLDSQVSDILDRKIGYLPRSLFMLGMGYTPRQFAESVCLPGDYVSLTSFTHHPFGEAFVLESPDNLTGEQFLNVPIDTLIASITRALRRGHAVCWEGDISEPGFRFDKGVAVLQGELQSASQDAQTPVTQQMRQRAFERFLTTDDHCMELCGLARDRRGRRFVIAKNSWGKHNPYGGYMYLSYDYVKLKTMAVVMKRSSLSSFLSQELEN